MTNALILLLVAWLFAAMPPSALADGGGDDKPSVRAPQKAVDPDYTAATSAIKGGDYAGAIKLLERVVARDAKDADAYNWLGYSTRYLQLNDVGKAREHLARLDKLCFFSCEEYRDLNKAVEAYERKNGRKP